LDDFFGRPRIPVDPRRIAAELPVVSTEELLKGLLVTDANAPDQNRVHTRSMGEGHARASGLAPSRRQAAGTGHLVSAPSYVIERRIEKIRNKLASAGLTGV
jgi:hypothetical protein